MADTNPQPAAEPSAPAIADKWAPSGDNAWRADPNHEAWANIRDGSEALRPEPPAAPAEHSREPIDEPAKHGDGEVLLATIKAAGIEPELVRDAFEWWKNGTPGFTAEQLEHIDRDDRDAATAELRALWGPKLAPNLAAIDQLLGTMPQGDLIRNARSADGKALTNSPAFLQRLLGVAGSPNAQIPTQGADETIAQIEALMKTDRARYNRDEPMQARLRAAYAERARKQA